MMCATCRQAGDALTLIMQDADADPATDALKAIAEWHGECKDPVTCTCQHFVEPVLA